MPTYDYRCNACGHLFEVFQSMTEAKKKKCPKCAKPKLERLIGPGAGFIFKGSGFYQTDYRSDSYQAAAKAESGGGSASSETAPSSEPSTSAPTETSPKAGEAKAKPVEKPSADKSSKKRESKKN